PAHPPRGAGGQPGRPLPKLPTPVTPGETRSHSAGAARDLLALRLHRHYPGSFAVGSLNFAATAMLMNADALDDAEHAMDVLHADAEDMAQPELISGALWQQAQIAYQRGDLARCELESRVSLEAARRFP